MFEKPGVRIGIALLVLGGTCNAMGVNMLLAERRGWDTNGGTAWIVFGLGALMLPGLLLVLEAHGRRRNEARMDMIVAVANTIPRVSFAQLADELGVSRRRARKLLLAAVGRGRVRGRVDLEQEVFVSSSLSAGSFGPPAQLPETMTCKGCGGESTVVKAVTAHAHRQYCGFRLH
ncbi:hypothetical protein OV090_26990 [Nannocystis sp. RBIL2]|uniref:hypothetical protein n=1 Tax=Nannocystis sp. RBIL2 TaxID=2996788 RepID=UPI00227043BD|nr:hypothetical protein [Nannocystis sp. RBIL2]MCY1068418.1 hypothetical protein [Nannocystis sp. RBIL2]